MKTLLLCTVQRWCNNAAEEKKSHKLRTAQEKTIFFEYFHKKVLKLIVNASATSLLKIPFPLIQFKMAATVETLTNTQMVILQPNSQKSMW